MSGQIAISNPVVGSTVPVVTTGGAVVYGTYNGNNTVTVP